VRTASEHLQRLLQYSNHSSKLRGDHSSVKIQVNAAA
jgi:hypothetical protein